MAELLAASEGDSEEASQVVERLREERRSMQRQYQKLRDSGKICLTIIVWQMYLTAEQS